MSGFDKWFDIYERNGGELMLYNSIDLEAAFLAGQKAEREAIGSIVEGRVTTVSVYATIVEAMVVTAFKRDILAAIKARGNK